MKGLDMTVHAESYYQGLASVLEDEGMTMGAESLRLLAKRHDDLAEENAKLRNVLYEIRDSGNIHDVTRLAIDALEG